MKKRSRENPIESIADINEKQNLLMSKALTVFKHVELSLTILEKNLGQYHKQLIKWKDVENGTQLSLQPSSSSLSTLNKKYSMNVITVDDFALIYFIAPVLYHFEIIHTNHHRLSSSISSSSSSSSSGTTSLADFSLGFYMKSNNDIFLNDNNHQNESKTIATNSDKINSSINTVSKSPSINKPSSSQPQRILSIPTLIELRKNYFRDELDAKLKNISSSDLNQLESINRSVFTDASTDASSSSSPSIASMNNEDSVNMEMNHSDTNQSSLSTTHNRLSIASVSTYVSPTPSNTNGSHPKLSLSSTPIKTIHKPISNTTTTTMNSNNRIVGSGSTEEFYDTVIRPFVSLSRLSRQQQQLQLQQQQQQQETGISLLQVKTQEKVDLSESQTTISSHSPIISSSSSSSSVGVGVGVVVGVVKPSISSLRLEDLKNLAIERGKVQQAIQNKIRQDKDSKMFLARLNHILFVADIIRSIYITKNKNSYVLSELIARLVIELPDLTQKDISDIIQLLIQQTPEFFVFVPRDAVCKQDVLRLNFHCPYSTQIRGKLLTYVKEMKKQINSHLAKSSSLSLS